MKAAKLLCRDRVARRPSIHADEEPHLARPRHHRLTDEAGHEFSPDRDGARCGGKTGFSAATAYRIEADPPVPVAKESAAPPSVTASAGAEGSGMPVLSKLANCSGSIGRPK